MSRRRARRAMREQARQIERDTSSGEKLYRLSKLAQHADVSKRTLERHVEKGLIDVVRVGPTKRIRVTESEYQRYLGIMKKGGDGD